LHERPRRYAVCRGQGKRPAIASAPDLVEALRSAFNCLESFRSDMRGYGDGAIAKVRAALEKAGAL